MSQKSILVKKRHVCEELKIVANSPIYINGNYWLGQNSTSGYGNSTHPYIIQDLFINVSGLGMNGIVINNTDAFFILHNCIITHADSGFTSIYCRNVRNGLIINNNTGNGIRLFYQCFNNTLINNTLVKIP